MGCIPSKVVKESEMHKRLDLQSESQLDGKQCTENDNGSLSHGSALPWVSGHPKIIVEQGGTIRIRTSLS